MSSGRVTAYDHDHGYAAGIDSATTARVGGTVVGGTVVGGTVANPPQHRMNYLQPGQSAQMASPALHQPVVAPVVAPVKKFAVMPKLASFGLGYGYSRPKPVNAVPAVTPSSHLNLDVPLREPSPEPIKEESPTPAAVSIKEEEPDDFDEDIDVQVRNVVCNYTLPLHIDLRRLALNTNNCTYDKGRGVLMKQKRNPLCYVKVYSSGKVYIVGCRSEMECVKASRGIARSIQRAMNKLNDVVRIRNYRVCNVLATCRLPFGVKIEEVAKHHPSETQYEPELNVGLIWRSKTPKATLRIHTTGSVSVTGACSEADVMTVIQKVYPHLKQFRCQHRHGLTLKAAKRKRAAPQGWPTPLPAKRYNEDYGTMKSGMIGNQIHFSDEEDLDMMEDQEDSDF